MKSAHVIQVQTPKNLNISDLLSNFMDRFQWYNTAPALFWELFF